MKLPQPNMNSAACEPLPARLNRTWFETTVLVAVLLIVAAALSQVSA